jgi:iron complex transport system permease protein
MTGRRTIALALVAALAAAVLFLAPWVGMQRIGWADVFSAGDPLLADIFWKIRFPRALVGFLAGCGLAAGGAAFQALFHNALAEPFILGVSAGASAGVALATYMGGGTAMGGFLALESVLAFLGALLAIGIVFVFSRLKNDAGPAAILLVGVAVNFFFSSLIMLIQHLVDPHNAARIFRAMIGGMAGAGQRQLLLALPFVALGAAITVSHWRELDILSLGEEAALSRGVDTARVRNRLFFGVSLTVGGITALCGPVGFVGLVAPHVCRMLAGPGHRLLIPAAGLFGGAFLVASDVAARTVIAPADLPVGVISALCGAPFFLWLLMRRERG